MIAIAYKYELSNVFVIKKNCLYYRGIKTMIFYH